MASHFETNGKVPAEYLSSSGWSAEEIQTYIPQIRALSDDGLLALHRLCSISMFSPGEAVDREQAIHVLLNENDTPKSLLIASLKDLLGERAHIKG